MSLKQFVWNLAGMESQIPEEDLPEEKEADVIDQPPSDKPEAELTEVAPASPSSFFNPFGDAIPSSPAPVSDEEKVPDSPHSPSFLGDLFGMSSPESAEPARESGGFGTFLTSFVGVGEETAPSKLQNLAEELSSPKISDLERKFDDVDAQDVVDSIENGSVDPVKRAPRLLVVDKVESQLKLLEAKSAMLKLKEVRKQTSDRLREDRLHVEQPKDGSLVDLNEENVIESKPIEQPQDVKPVESSKEGVMKGNGPIKEVNTIEAIKSTPQKSSEVKLTFSSSNTKVNESKSRKLDEYDSIKKALAVIQPRKLQTSSSFLKKEKLREKAKPLSGPYKAFHTFEPLHNASFSSRITDFPVQPSRPLHSNRGLPSVLSPGYSSGGMQKPSIVVTSVESRVIPRVSHIF
jgi:hypothetical protein